jgi:hypothetical protein
MHIRGGADGGGGRGMHWEGWMHTPIDQSSHLYFYLGVLLTSELYIRTAVESAACI